MFGDSTRIYNSDRTSGATDMGMPARAHGADTPGLYLEEAYEDQAPGGIQRLACIRKPT
jgi:hypothetical protein